ncbi:MAG: methyl-accepting chemotaxis protein [Lachnospiraceae bacterium]
MDFSNVSDECRVNQTAMFSYTVMDFILIACYLVEVLKKSRSLSYFLIFTVLALVPYIICKVLVARDKETMQIKYVMAVGFLIFYVFIIFTTISPIAYVYAIMMAVIMLCYNDNKLIFLYMLSVTLVNIAQTIYLAANHLITSEDLPNVEIRIASLILFTLYLTMSTKAAELTNQNRMEQIKTEQEKTAKLMDQILRVSGQMTENIGTVSEKMEILSDTANKTKMSMEEVTQGTGETSDSIQMQMEKTAEIDQAIRHVSTSTATISDNIGATREEIAASKTNIDELIRHVELSNKSNQDVSDEIAELNEYAEKMQSIIGLINGVTTQTSLLALNASIEAARAGEAGRGFAVVASEISNLATQTKDATVNITELINNVSNELSSMVDVIEDMLHNAEEQNEVANNTARCFEGITIKVENVYHEVEKLDKLVAGLNDANEQVIRGIETISAATEEVTAHSNQTLETSEMNSSITDEVEAMVEALSSLADELQAVES